MDIDNMPSSEVAKDILNMVSPVYDKSYVGKCLFEVIASVLEDPIRFFRTMSEECFPETATWSLPYWEELYGLDINEGLTVQERRGRIRSKRNLRKPMNKAKIESILGAMINGKATVTEHVADMTMDVTLQPGSRVMFDEVSDMLKEVKQAHIGVTSITSSQEMSLAKRRVFAITTRPRLVMSFSTDEVIIDEDESEVGNSIFNFGD